MEGQSDGIEPVNEDLINQRIEMLRDNFLELQDENHVLLSKVNDIYFLDFGLFSDELKLKHNLARKNKYKLAKVVRVTDDNVAIVYGRFFYQWQYSVVSSIKYGDLSNDDYYMPIPDYIPLSKIREMKSNGAIYLVKRPVRNQLYGNFVRP